MICTDRCDLLSGVESVRRCAGPRDRLTPRVAWLRWVLGAVIAANLLLTLLGQPESFWRDPTTAIRGDGLSVYATINPSFDFFLSHGALPFIATRLLYFAAIFFAVSRLTRALATIALFALLFAHGYDITNWLVVRFHFGMGGGVTTCGTALGVLLSFAILPTSRQPRAAIDGLRWLMVAALLVDFANTLIGQPHGYWLNPVAMHEGNSLTRLFLGRGWMYFLGLEVILAAGQFALVTFLPIPVAFVTAFAFFFASFIGATNWFYYEWRWGWIAPLCYGAILGALLVKLAFREDRDSR